MGKPQDPPVTPPVVTEPPATPAPTPAPAITHSDEAYQKLLAQNKALNTEVGDFKTKATDAENAKLKEQGKWEDIATREKARADAAETKLTGNTKAFEDTQRYNAIKELAVTKNIRKDVLAGGDLQMALSQAGEDVKVVYNTAGQMEIQGGQQFVDRLALEKPYLFTDKVMPNITGKIPIVLPVTGTITTDQIRAAQKEAKKTGDSTQYKSLHAQYQQQQAAAKRVG